MKQVRLDCDRAILRARYCGERSEVYRLRCVDDRQETELQFGNQLWYFEALGVDHAQHCQTVFGVVEYSTQFGLNELVEDAVYVSESQREKFRRLYEREVIRPSWQQPAHRWLVAGLIAVTSIWLLYLLLRTLSL
ncbi:MAG: hypothetical protein HKN47_28560 [Pirellulaceae bacterium]|nr:hypothetical protein [Pirellulaceae bacterium]